MKRVLFLTFVALLAFSCAPYYSGTITYYFPDGTQESYTATKELGGKSGSVSVNYGAKQILVTNDIPWRFDGTLVQGKRSKDSQSQPFYFSYNGETFEISDKVVEKAKKQAIINDRLNPDLINDYLIKYVQKTYGAGRKYKDGIYD